MDRPLICEVCKKSFKEQELFPLELVHNSLMQKIEQDTKDLDDTGYVCLPDLERYQLSRSRQLLEQEFGVLNEVEEEVLSDLKTDQLITENINEEYEESLTFGERMADHISSFGGSWRFIGIFFSVLILWMLLNSWILLSETFDPYPYILLNLLLSCLAAIQAPVIMMSQNRQAEKDRLAAENDFKVNLKSELLIHQLTSKLDHLMKEQRLRTLQHQQMQVEVARAVLNIQQIQTQTTQTMSHIQEKLESVDLKAKKA
jgi:uncharacterized membrane protein